MKKHTLLYITLAALVVLMAATASALDNRTIAIYFNSSGAAIPHALMKIHLNVEGSNPQNLSSTINLTAPENITPFYIGGGYNPGPAIISNWTFAVGQNKTSAGVPSSPHFLHAVHLINNSNRTFTWTNYSFEGAIAVDQNGTNITVAATIDDHGIPRLALFQFGDTITNTCVSANLTVFNASAERIRPIRLSGTLYWYVLSANDSFVDVNVTHLTRLYSNCTIASENEFGPQLPVSGGTRYMGIDFAFADNSIWGVTAVGIWNIARNLSGNITVYNQSRGGTTIASNDSAGTVFNVQNVSEVMRISLSGGSLGVSQDKLSVLADISYTSHYGDQVGSPQFGLTNTGGAIISMTRSGSSLLMIFGKSGSANQQLGSGVMTGATMSSDSQSSGSESGGSGSTCGNNIKEGTENCDDGNLVNGDGCDNQCQGEASSGGGGGGSSNSKKDCVQIG